MVGIKLHACLRLTACSCHLGGVVGWYVWPVGLPKPFSSGDIGAYSCKHFGMLLEKTVSFVKRKYGSCKAPEQDRVLIWNSYSHRWCTFCIPGYIFYILHCFGVEWSLFRFFSEFCKPWGSYILTMSWCNRKRPRMFNFCPATRNSAPAARCNSRRPLPVSWRRQEKGSLFFFSNTTALDM